MRNINILIKDQRNKLGLTMEDVAKKSKLSQGFVSKLESGSYEPTNLSLDTIIRLSHALNLKVKDFLDTLQILEQDSSPALNVYLRKKYEIKDKNDVEIIESMIKRLINKEK